jgi:leucyl-tRNA synthetase
MEKYDPRTIEKKWQKKWEKEKIFEAKDFSKNPKFFILDMFPYPSGAGLHVGHPRGYVGSDIIAHFKRMNGYNVLHPMGWDAFGLPAENYAIKTGIHPEISIKENVERFKKQMNNIGLSYDWSRELNTTDPDYYKWTQWIFLKLFERGLAYQSTLPINWCPSCKTGLANEEVVGGKCERCGTIVTKKNIKQWVLKITDYAEKLLDGLDKLDWPEQIKEMQRNWIGKSQGADIVFSVDDSKLEVKIFTTRPDTIFGATFMVLSPEHELVGKITTPDKLEDVKKYQEETKKKLDIERQMEDKEKTGVFIGAYAINPATKEKIPIYIADYVLPHYGYGAIMGVPSHDERDYGFAKKFNLPIKKIELNKTIKQTIKWLEKKACGEETINYKLRDWIFSRQRYWGEPIPLVFCEKSKERIEKGDYEKGEFSKGELLNPGWIALSKKDLPLELPNLEKYQPSGTGESPLIQAKEWVQTKCPKCGSVAVRETNTMPQWAGSCWYFIRYLDSKNKEELAGSKLMKKWLPVDFYIGGAEHAVLHLLYSRFWIKVLYDAKIIHFNEPFLKLQTIGLILASDGQKMSKSRGNVINPDEVIENYGTDAFRLYEMFMGPFDQSISWDSDGILGTRRFLEKIWNIFSELNGKDSKKIERKLHQLIKKVTEDVETQKFNTAISTMMEFINEVQVFGISKEQAEIFLKILTPFAPHITEELWQKLGHGDSIFKEKWPEYDKTLIKEEAFYLIVQINGRLRDTIGTPLGISEKQAKDLALKSEKIQKWLENNKIKKTIFVKDKLINFVIE